MASRPANDEELQKREAIGVIRASRFVREYAHLRQAITVDTICEIHKRIFKDAWPEIAGVWRIENLEISDSKHKPPHFSKVSDFMRLFDEELSKRLGQLKSTEAFWMDNAQWTEENGKALDSIIETSAWIHHKITHVHPFREGNGRTARLTGNLILERYGLVGISIKVERENKNKYRDTLAQIDQHEDFEPLKELIYEGLLERYNGVAMKYLK